MRRSSDAQWWVLLTIALLLVLVWPPASGTSLAVKVLNRAADPGGRLPTRPRPLDMEEGDDPVAVSAHDRQLQEYDALYAEGGWTRMRLRLKAARDPLDAATERQVLTAIAVVVAFLALRANAKKE